MKNYKLSELRNCYKLQPKILLPFFFFNNTICNLFSRILFRLNKRLKRVNCIGINR